MHACFLYPPDNPLTQVSTEGHLSQCSWYSTTVGPDWSDGVVCLSTSQSDDLTTIPANVELLSSIPGGTIVQYHTPIRIRPLTQWSITIVVSKTSTTGTISVTDELGQTTRSILSNVSDEDLSIVSSDGMALIPE